MLDWYILLGILSVFFLIVFGCYRVLAKKQGSWAKEFSPYSNLHNRLTNTSKPRESSGEKRTRHFLESYFGEPFQKLRPSFLKNNVTGGTHNLELDCYNEELGLAAEYNGEQHYKFIPFFHKSREAFYNQKYRDELKRIYCKDRGIHLIEVPYTELKNLENWLLEKIKIFLQE